MKTKHVYLRKILLLVALLSVSLTTVAQKISTPALCALDEAPEARFALNAPKLGLTGMLGDVNHDAKIDVTDVTMLIQAILLGNTIGNGDMNADGRTDVTDVTKLIGAILNGESTGYDAAAALQDLNEVYTSMRTVGWTTTGNAHQRFGISAYTLMAEVMGDDLIMGDSGSGWFWFDASYNVKTRYNSTAWRSYDLWKAYYTWIAQANYILTATRNMTGAAAEVNYVKGQAYAIRAYSYFMLAQAFARTYKGHESEPCVPIYAGVEFNGSTGQPRSTIAQVYAQIDADIAQAVNLLNGTTQQAPHHMGYAVALALRARVALVKENWATAYNSAVAAINASGKEIQPVSSFAGLNDALAGNVMWGIQIAEDQVGGYASLWAHMMPEKAYGMYAPKQISKWLYDKMSATDTRLAWWKENTTGRGSDAMVQDKFRVKDGTEWGGDYIWMRVEEMYLTAAEAACRRGLTATARNYLNALMKQRDVNYSCTKTGTVLGSLTTDESGSLLEEILIQRRIELWGEDGRINTIRRLRQGFVRNIDDGWPAVLTSGHAWIDPECYAWVLTIPQSEFNGNSNMTLEADQNPLGDYSAAGQNVTFETAVMSVITAQENRVIQVTIKRANTVGDYSAMLQVVESNNINGGTVVANFNDGSDQAVVNINFMNMDLGTDYYCVLRLSSVDVTGEPGQITTTRINVSCANGNPTGQNISFESASMNYGATGMAMSVPVTLTRAVTTGEYRATFSVTKQGDDGYTYNQSVVFLDGENTATTDLWVDGLESGKSSTFVLQLSPVDVATAAGTQIATATVTVSRDLWEDMGNATFVSDLLGETFTSVVARLNGTNKYRLKDLFGYGYDIDLTIEGGNVYIEAQPAFVHSRYGVVTMQGYANQDEPGYAGTFDAATRQATLAIIYYCDEGSFGTVEDTLTMP